MSVAESTAHVISSLSKETVRTLIGGGGGDMIIMTSKVQFRAIPSLTFLELPSCWRCAPAGSCLAPVARIGHLEGLKACRSWARNLLQYGVDGTVDAKPFLLRTCKGACLNP